MNYKIPFILTFLIFPILMHSQYKQEFRGAWIASVSNLDWPKSADRGNAAAQQADLIQIFDKMMDLNMNVALLQVRTECDALYNSAYEPWSRYLNSPQGTDPGYDPLQFAIEEAHKRGIELHAWLNPYRINASTSDGGDYYHSTHVYTEHPEWAIVYPDNKKILNPGLPQVVKYIKQVVGDIVQNYDVDGIHFDDYFYSYNGTSDVLDQDAFDTYGGAYANRGDFRRGSINYMVSEVYDTIQQVRPYVRFGISPFGIYGNGMNPPGIAGLDSYNTIYCDALAWLSTGTVDYINPQLYWPTGGAQDYETLLPWWGQHAFNNNRHLYSGNGTYRLSDNPATKVGLIKRFFRSVGRMFTKKSTSDPVAAWTLGQIELQMDINRANRTKNVLGSVFFRYRDFDRVNGLADYTKNNIFVTKSLPPAMDWKTAPSLSIPTNLRIEYDAVEGSNFLKWDYPNTETRFAIYMDDLANGDIDITNPDNIYGLSYENKIKLEGSFPVPQAVRVTALDRDGFESAGSVIYGIDPPGKPVLTAPANESTVAQNFDFEWQNLTDASSYVIEVANDASFNTILASESGISGNLLSSTTLSLSGDQNYFWRVAGVNPGGKGAFSDPFSFTAGFPGTPEITNPSDKENNVALTPEIEWSGVSSATTIYIEISEGGTAFNENNLVVNQSVSNPTGSATVSTSLKEYTSHYVRLKAENSYGTSFYSDTVQFKTLKLPPAQTQISSPINEEENVVIPTKIEWNAVDGATSYMVEIAESNAFSNPVVTKEVFLTNAHSETSLVDNKAYYLRVASKNLGGLSLWSDTVKFYTGVATTIKEVEPSAFNLLCFPNPTGDQLTISYKIAQPVIIELKIIDQNGKVYKKISNGLFKNGEYKMEINVSDLKTGIYFIEILSKKREVINFIKK